MERRATDVVAAVLLVAACSGGTGSESTDPPITAGPAADRDTTIEVDAATTTTHGEPIEPDSESGWRVSTPEAQGIDSVALAELVDHLRTQDNIAIHSLLIVRHGHVVADVYFHPYTPDAVHDLQSAVKSFESTLIGIAIDRGHIESVTQPILTFFPDRRVANVDADKESMTLEDLLVMRSGLLCGSDADLAESSDWVQSILDQPMIGEPGRAYDYCNSNFYLLSAILESATGMTESEFAEQNLFTPLDMGEILWPEAPREAAVGESHYAMTPRDMAKLGQLFLDGGVWDGEQVVSSAWVQAATGLENASYGYMWWLDSAGYYATGVGGQEIWVVPDLDMVVVMTGATGGGGTGAWGSGLMYSRILPLAESETPLPSNPDGSAALDSETLLAAAPVPVAPTLPETAQRVTGQTFMMDTNPAGLASVSLDFTEETQAAVNLGFSGGGRAEWLIGLDGTYRYFQGDAEFLSAATGWWESDDVFVVEQEEVGGVTTERLTVTFDSDRITLEIREFFLGPVGEVTFTGRLQQ